MHAAAAYNFSTMPASVSETGAAAKRLGGLISTQFSTARTVLIGSDPGLLNAGPIDGPKRSLHEHDIAMKVFADVTADPPEHVVESAVRLARECLPALVIALGGGSSLDVVKLVAVIDQANKR